MSQMVERVARAILYNSPGFGQLEDHTARARAAIAAMREPTEAMLKAAEREWDGRLSFRATGAWQAMIDEALR